MTSGIEARIDRIGSKGRIVNIPMDHGITIGVTAGLKNIEETINRVTQGGADSVLTHKGLASRVHRSKNDAGYIVHLNGSTSIGPDENDKRITCTIPEAIRAGADAVSFHINIGSSHEPRQIEELSTVVNSANRYGMPVLAMTYPRGQGVDKNDPGNLAHAVRVGEELGASIVKTPYSNDRESFREVVNSTALPVLMAGGKPEEDVGKLSNVKGAMDAGAAGVSMGRSVFQHENPRKMAHAISKIVHDDLTVEEAVEASALND